MIEKPKPCLEHDFARDRQGYARTSYLGQITGLHRRVYCQTRDVTLESIKGLVVRHTCDNPACIEPTHLLLGTKADNNRDRAERGRSADRRGEAHPLAMLNENQVKEIRKQYADKCHNQRELAQRLNCSQSLISLVVHRKVWSHI